MGSKRKIQRNAVLKVVNRKVCPRIFKYHQEVLAIAAWKLEIMIYLSHEQLLNKQSELISKYHLVNKYLLSYYKSND